VLGGRRVRAPDSAVLGLAQYTTVGAEYMVLPPYNASEDANNNSDVVNR
jgi:hypothetical protein